ncbi:MAG TPA: arginine--tRNA ligase [Verrucomicrobiae bacterium]|nr:arginine--tRNA ligase [Verrucomicrobiae bacterium]
MNPVIRELETALKRAMAGAGLESVEGRWDFRPCADARHGDYQANPAMVLAKEVGRNPREIANDVANRWGAGALAGVGVAGPGFLNFKLTEEALVRGLEGRQAGRFIEAVERPKTIVVDFSAPNVAKSMHVGHIRSTVLGDSLQRVARYIGHRVISDNHIGDWGTQFGKLIVGLRRFGSDEALLADPIGEMERLYKLTHEASQSDPEVQEAARQELKKLQDGDPANLALWRRLRELSQSAFERIYARLGVHFDESLGESFYNPMLRGVVEELVARGVARESEGAICVFFDEAGLKDKPFLIRKSDGAALYSTTDLATVKHRVEAFRPDEIWYVVDMRQSLHFQQLFATVRHWGLGVEMRHVGFGSILGADKRPLKTREGDPVKLDALLDEAVVRARAIVDERRGDLGEEERRDIAEALGIGSVKYADLVQNRHLDYVFEWDRLLSFDGNTAPYVLNAYVRIRSIFRKSGDPEDAEYRLGPPSHPRERDLMMRLLQWEDVVAQVASEQRPHHLCFYLFGLAGCFHAFFEDCPVLKADAVLRSHRLALCRATAGTLRAGCELLGLKTVERM